MLLHVCMCLLPPVHVRLHASPNFLIQQSPPHCTYAFRVAGLCIEGGLTCPPPFTQTFFFSFVHPVPVNGFDPCRFVRCVPR